MSAVSPLLAPLLRVRERTDNSGACAEEKGGEHGCCWLLLRTSDCGKC